MEEIRSPLKAIKAFCIDCSGGSADEARKCKSQICPLHAFRKGKNPYSKRNITEEQKEAFRIRMNQYRAQQLENNISEDKDG